MSAGDYYNPNNRYGANASPQPVGEPYAHYDRGRSPAPAYTPTPQQHLGANDRSDRTGQSGHASGTSPFDSVFDDHVYPANTPSSSQHQLNDIPLQNQSRAGAPKDHADMQDHVYDAPQRKRARKAGVRFGELGMFGANNAKRIPWVVYLFTVVQVVVFIVEIVKNATATGSPIMIQPSFNPMIGPSPYILINMGARFVPCMHNVQQIQTSPVRIKWPCPNTTTLDGNSLSNNCTLSELCGFGGVPEFYAGPNGMDSKPEPNQWFRFITPIFMHAGIIHIGFNLLLQLTMGREMEKSIGSIRFFLVYMSAGIFGFVLGSNFAAAGIPSTGASGSLFGVIALTLLDLLYSWKDRRSPVKDLMFILLDVIISFVLGLLPGLDNFSHIGGFLMGLALGICVLHSPNALRRRIGDDAPYSQVNNGYLTHGAPPSFLKNPVGFFKGRKPLWWAWWLVRAGALVLVTIVFILLLNNFYIYRNTCSWCKYLSCLPVNNWCEIGNLTLSDTPKRSFIPSALGGLEESVKLW